MTSTEDLSDRPPGNARPMAAFGSDDAIASLARGQFYEDDEIASIKSRAVAYLAAGVPVHFRGPAGVGKTTLALRVAAELGRESVLITGDHWMTSGDLVGREVGQTTRQLRDSYIHSVRRVESSTRADWQDSILTTAMAQGQTLVYDEFTRAPPEANSALLSALEERLIVVANPASSRRTLAAHPDFRVIMTSNPSDYQGVSAAPDALLDRLVTFDLEHVSTLTETGIVAQRSGLDRSSARLVVDLVRRLRARPELAYPPSMRTAILICRLAKSQSASVTAADKRFVQICLDVLEGRLVGDATGTHQPAARQILHTEILNTGIPTPDSERAAS